MADDPKAGGGKQQSFDEIVWTVKRSKLLFDYWTIPLLADTTKQPGSEDVVGARAFALVVIVALTFAVRGEPLGGTVSYTVLASALAAALSVGLNLLSKTTQVNVREPALVSAYSSTILVMLGFLAIKPLQGINWYSNLTESFGDVLTPVCLSVVFVYVLLVLKAKLWDRNTLSGAAALQGLVVTIGSGVIVYVIYNMSNEWFTKATNFVCTFGACTVQTVKTCTTLCK
jgi:hypothetical protein